MLSSNSSGLGCVPTNLWLFHSQCVAIADLDGHYIQRGMICSMIRKGNCCGSHAVLFEQVLIIVTGVLPATVGMTDKIGR